MRTAISAIGWLNQSDCARTWGQAHVEVEVGGARRQSGDDRAERLDAAAGELDGQPLLQAGADRLSSRLLGVAAGHFRHLGTVAKPSQQKGSPSLVKFEFKDLHLGLDLDRNGPLHVRGFWLFFSSNFSRFDWNFQVLRS